MAQNAQPPPRPDPCLLLGDGDVPERRLRAWGGGRRRGGPKAVPPPQSPRLILPRKIQKTGKIKPKKKPDNRGKETVPIPLRRFSGQFNSEGGGGSTLLGGGKRPQIPNPKGSRNLPKTPCPPPPPNPRTTELQGKKRRRCKREGIRANSEFLPQKIRPRPPPGPVQGVAREGGGGGCTPSRLQIPNQL